MDGGLFASPAIHDDPFLVAWQQRLPPSRRTRQAPAGPAHRQRKRMTVRHRAIDMSRVPARERRHLRVLYGSGDHWRPAQRGDCATFERPCPYVGCAHHLFLEVTAVGNITLNHPDLLDDWVLEGPRMAGGRFFTDSDDEPVIPGPHLEHMPATCALDVADENAGANVTNEDVGRMLRLSRERVRQELLRLLAMPELAEALGVEGDL